MTQTVADPAETPPAPPAPPLELRNLEFELGPDVPRAWHPAGPAVTAFYNNLSILFPAGERFFIASVKAHRRHVTGARLREDVRLFCAQEGVHSREHRRYNELLRAQGYPIAAMEARAERILGAAARLLPARWQLAATCALEHFTALMAHLLLEDPRMLAGAHPQLAALWRWHAAEENEHKAVAFDVYAAAGGTFLARAGLMLVVTAIFWAKIFEQQLRLMRADGVLGSFCEWRALGRYLFVEPGGMARLWRLYLPYFRPRFHPMDIDSTALLARWKAGYAAAGAAPLERS